MKIVRVRGGHDEGSAIEGIYRREVNDVRWNARPKAMETERVKEFLVD